jgi:hypothetical protein
VRIGDLNKEIKMKTRTVPLAILLFSLAPFSFAQNAAGVSGQFDFGQIPGISSRPSVEINLNAQMLAFVRAAAGSSDSDAADILAGIESVRVLVYELDEEMSAVLEFIDEVSTALEADEWQRVVYVQEETERVSIYVKFNETSLAGLTLLVADAGGEAVFANLAGDIDPAKLGAVSQALGIGDVLAGIPDLTGGAIGNAEADEE